MYRPPLREIRKRARLLEDNIEEQAKKIIDEPSEAPLLPIASRELDREKLKREFFFFY